MKPTSINTNQQLIINEEQALRPFKTKKKGLFIIFLGSISLILVLLITLVSLSSHTSRKTDYGEWNSYVMTSNTLTYIFQEDFDKYTMNIIDEAINEFFSSLYPSGAGIGYVSYNVTQDNYSLRIIDSHGIFHTLTIHKNEDKVNVKIDDFEKTYEIEKPNQEEED